MSKANDGGQAFPCTWSDPTLRLRDGTETVAKGATMTVLGMSRRDYFAAAAMQGLLADSHSGMSIRGVAAESVRAADFLLTELAKEAKP